MCRLRLEVTLIYSTLEALARRILIPERGLQGSNWTSKAPRNMKRVKAVMIRSIGNVRVQRYTDIICDQLTN